VAINLAEQLADLSNRGFNAEQARTIVLIGQAAATLFQDFPDAFVVFGGATLVLFHDSVRHSNDLDLLSKNEALPSSEAIIESLKRGLQAPVEALNLGTLEYSIKDGSQPELKIFVANAVGSRLFQIDFTRIGSVIASEIEDHPIEIDGNIPSQVQSVSKEFLLLQKGETFLQRRVIKARDAYDIHYLFNLGAKLSEVLHGHLEDSLSGSESGPDEIRERIGQLTFKLCQKELQPLLPPGIFERLEKEEFRPLRDAVATLYEDWLQ
jgi:hypothetical protein